MPRGGTIGRPAGAAPRSLPGRHRPGGACVPPLALQAHHDLPRLRTTAHHELTVQAHLEAVEGVGTVAAGGLAGGDLQAAGGHAHRALHLQHGRQGRGGEGRGGQCGAWVAGATGGAPPPVPPLACKADAVLAVLVGFSDVPGAARPAREPSVRREGSERWWCRAKCSTGVRSARRRTVPAPTFRFLSLAPLIRSPHTAGSGGNGEHQQ